MKKSDNEPFSDRVKRIIKSVPRGKVATYGQVAALAGNIRAARQVAWILHSSSDKHNLPWHRIINSRGSISLKPLYGFEIQKELLQNEGVVFSENGTIDLSRYLWRG